MELKEEQLKTIKQIMSMNEDELNEKLKELMQDYR